MTELDAGLAVMAKSGADTTKVAVAVWTFPLVAPVPVTDTVKEPVEAGAVKVKTEVPELPLMGFTEKDPPLAPAGRVTVRLTFSVSPFRELTVTV